MIPIQTFKHMMSHYLSDHKMKDKNEDPYKDEPSWSSYHKEKSNELARQRSKKN